MEYMFNEWFLCNKILNLNITFPEVDLWNQNSLSYAMHKGVGESSHLVTYATLITWSILHVQI